MEHRSNQNKQQDYIKPGSSTENDVPLKKRGEMQIVDDTRSQSNSSSKTTRNTISVARSLSSELSDHRRRRSLERNNETNIMVSQALTEFVSENGIAGPRGALFPVLSETSMEGGISTTSTHTIERLYLRRKTREGTDVPLVFDDAIAETGHGCFQYKLMALCGFIYACCSLSTTTLSFILPAAQYDFQLNSVDKGILNTAPLCGMVAGAYVWGNFADSKGRRFVILYSLLIDAFAAFTSSFCQKYLLFFICRIFNGFAIIGATSIVFAYLGEFIDPYRRDRYLSLLELFWTFGIIALPVIGFAILPRDWVLSYSDIFVYNSWRMFVFACGVPSLIAAILISRMPESPRFLLLQGHHEKTRNVLMRMFVSNTNRIADDYPVRVLNVGNEVGTYYFSQLHEGNCCDKVKRLCIGLGKQHRDLLRGQSLFNIIITCFIDFGLMSVYYTIMLWVPELIHREEQFMRLYPGESATLCRVSEKQYEVIGDGKVDSSTFIHTFIICVACLPSNVLLLFFIHVVSKKALLVALMLCTAVPTTALYFMDSTFKITTMLCLFEAVATIIETVLFCTIIEIFPLNTRGTALALTVTIGRLGAVMGNIIFGFLIDNHCTHLFFGMSGMLVLSSISALFLPKMGRNL